MKNIHKLQAFNLETTLTFVHETFIHFLCFLKKLVVKPTQVIRKNKNEENRNRTKFVRIYNNTKKDIMKITQIYLWISKIQQTKNMFKKKFFLNMENSRDFIAQKNWCHSPCKAIRKYLICKEVLINKLFNNTFY